MKKLFFLFISLLAFHFSQAQYSIKADYEGGIENYCGAQGNGFYEAAGGHVRATYNSTTKSEQLTYDIPYYTTGAGFFKFAVAHQDRCLALGRELDSGINMSQHKKVSIKIKASTPIDLNFYLGSAGMGGWGPTSSTHSIYGTGMENPTSISKTLHLTTDYQIFEIDYSGDSLFDKWQLKNKVNTFGFEFLSPTDAIVDLAFVKINAVQSNINFESLADKTYGNSDFYLSATETNNLPLTYTSSNTDVATIINNKVHIVGAGQTTINTFQALTPSDIVSQVLMVNRAPQTITFPEIASDTFDIFPDTVALYGFSNSGLNLSYSLINNTNAIISGSTVIVNGPGLISIEASQNGNKDWLATSNKITHSFIITSSYSGSKSNQIITAPIIGNVTRYVFPDTIHLKATSSSNLPMSYVLEFGNGNITHDNVLTCNSPGYYTVSYYQFGDNNWNAATKVSETFTVSAPAKSLFKNGDKSFAANYDKGFQVYCGASGRGYYEAAGGFVGISNYNSNEGALEFPYSPSYYGEAGWFGFVIPDSNYNCRVMGREANSGVDMSQNQKVNITIKASEPTDLQFYLGYAPIGSYSPATSTFNTIGNAGGSSIIQTLHLTTSYQTFTIDYADSLKFAAWADNNKVNSFGFAFLGPATNAVISLKSIKINERFSFINFDSLAPVTLETSDFLLTATVNSGLTPTYTSSNTDVATVVNGLVHLVGIGSTVITASQSGNVDFDSAISVSRTLVVTKGIQVLQSEPINPDSIVSYPTSISLRATSNSGLPLVYTVSGNATIEYPTQRTTGNPSSPILKITGSGIITLSISQAGSTSWNPLEPTEKQFIAITKYSSNRSNQLVNASAIGDQVVGSYPSTITLNATSTSGLPVTYTIDYGNAIIEGNTVTLLGPGDFVIAMQQYGDNQWNASSKTTQSFRSSSSITTVIEDQKLSEIVQLYPNPSNGTLFVNAYNEEVINITLTNTLGIQETHSSSSSITTLLKGFIIAKIITKTNNYTQKLIIE